MNFENYDLCFPDQPVVDLYLPIWANLPAFRQKPAFVWIEDGPTGASSSSAITYEQLNNSVQSMSSQLSVSLQRRDTVVVLCEPGLDLVEIIFACQRAGLLAVPMTPPHPSFANNNHHHLVRVLSQTKPKAALAKHSYINRIREYISSTSSSSTKNRLFSLLQVLRWISIEELKVDDVQKSSSLRYEGCKQDEVYLIQYTSGATAIPKPVLVTAGTAAHNVRVARKAYDLHPNSIIVSWLPQYHDCGLMFLLLSVICGTTCVLTSPSAFINRPRLWLELITEYKATCTPVPSFTLPLVVRRGGMDKGTSSISLGSMKNLIIIKEPIYKASIEKFLEVFRPFGLNPTSISPSYGLAENCTFVSTSWRSESDGNFPIHKNLLPSAKLPSSRQETIEEEIEILVVNEETHEPVEDGIEGEIWICSPSNAIGYLDHPSLTRETFNARIRNMVQCFVRTGDRGIVIGQERYLYVTGRCSDIIKHPNGQEIHAHYIETAACKKWPEMIRAGCVGAFEFSGSIAVAAELRRGEEEQKILMEICKGIRDEILNEEKVEVGLVVLVKSGNVPRTTSGKIKRWAAKYGLERGEMKVVMKMEFCDEGKKFEVAKEKEGLILTTTNTRNHLSLLSSL
ncbi:Acyl-CoA synthetase [Handroanthus impetiginosus]|uniref:Acyl-CoA synthetase n=1 Tax=Handroanthus impetiginosus TaxID=429701 RepID=A0A2G9H6C8_9LAMI|nr:Acyl-CoA synthetase [Handroanthus impetiginosus]